MLMQFSLPNVQHVWTLWPILFALVILLLLLIFWIFQFVELMSLDDERFPGVYARLGWVAAFIVLWMVTPFAFLLWRSRQSHALRSSSKDGPPPPSSRRRSQLRRAEQRARYSAGEHSS
jgi:hypothetical protein